MDTSLEWKIVVGQRLFTSEHHTVEGEEEDRNNHGRTKWRTSWEADTYKKIWQKVAYYFELVLWDEALVRFTLEQEFSTMSLDHNFGIYWFVAVISVLKVKNGC